MILKSHKLMELHYLRVVGMIIYLFSYFTVGTKSTNSQWGRGRT